MVIAAFSRPVVRGRDWDRHVEVQAVIACEPAQGVSHHIAEVAREIDHAVVLPGADEIANKVIVGETTVDVHRGMGAAKLKGLTGGLNFAQPCILEAKEAHASNLLGVLGTGHGRLYDWTSTQHAALHIRRKHPIQHGVTTPPQAIVPRDPLVHTDHTLTRWGIRLSHLLSNLPT